MCESNSNDRIIIPAAQAFEVVGRASQVYVRECPCRALAQNCSRDIWEGCLLFENAAPEDLQGARSISTAEASAILKAAAERNSVYNLFYTHDDRIVTELCNCCTCCCRPLRRMKEAGNYRVQLRSEYVAVTDAALCVGCGACAESCFFEARQVEDGALHLLEERCFGCGRCIESCPEGAIRLEREVGRGVSIPSST